MSQPIPAPPSIPFLGHIGTIDAVLPVSSFYLLAKQYGEIYQLNMLGKKLVVVNSQELLHEVSDEKRFRKVVQSGLVEVRNAAGDGLFTAHVPKEQNWFIAHRILMPSFSAMNMRNMFDDMVDVVSQLVLKWERFGPYYKINPAEDFTALTLEAISFCAMSYRMNTFYMNDVHPFARAMSDFLLESGARARRPALVAPFMRGTNAKYQQDIDVLMGFVDEIIAERRTHPTDKKDILNTMLHAKDKETGLGMTEDNIRRNLLTFLIAGHETTSGMLTFTMYYLLKNPEAMRKLREEVDTVVGSRPMTVDDVNKLPYMIAVMRESLRLGPPASARGASPYEDTVIGGGKYALEKDVTIVCSVYNVHRDTKVWGEDAEEFKPERMLDGKFEAMPPDSWQPFGYGMRACIGRPFAWQEAQITLVYLMQRFTFVLADASYDLRLKQTLTIKPHEFYIHALPRADRKGALPLFSTPAVPRAADAAAQPAPDAASLKPLYVLYGSNTGTSEAFAQRIASAAASHGFRASIATLDSAAGHLPTDGPLAVVTASYEGQPADNAAHFVAWLSALDGEPLAGAAHAVFGCGNHDWALTYQRVPTLVDDALAARGAKRILARGEGDAGAGDFFEAFDRWEARLWEALSKEYGTTKSDGAESGIKIETGDVGTGRASILRQPDAALGTVVENRVLTAPGAPVKRHIEFTLPEGMVYRTGDYLAILPVNPERDVHRALAHFGLLPDQEITIRSVGPTTLPTDRLVNVSSLLSGYVELSQPATTRDLRVLGDLAKDGASKAALADLASAYSEKVLAQRLSVLDLLEAHPSISLPFPSFLQLLPSMRVRQYSIASSPLADAARAALAISVLEAPAMSGRREPFLGVASTYLARLRPNDRVQLAVRPSAAAFHPPADPATPMIMVCAGSGLAPMRGFLQERALQKKGGREVGKSVLFFGCRRPGEDYLYEDSDLKEWAELGVVDVRPAFSRESEKSLGCKYVQDRVWHDRADVVSAWEAGAKIFICGSSKMAAGVKEKLVLVVQDQAKLDHDAATKKFEQITVGRFATDVFE
ncbi:bifunctional P-450/NADPH-P450 reductase [Phanerochaete sordida]|uniref:Bifunctional P-450/NADPH-P450 reductase n=1 Tax=Phanerochaete sordida TaxID=48140 RepID=A0A9P3G9P7_9APHY|nr:bifunctional P-450/NADPH-P450 reductase [Phanerochaete sordida]